MTGFIESNKRKLLYYRNLFFRVTIEKNKNKKYLHK